MAVEGRTQRPIVDNEKCNVCAVCIKGCPAEIIPEMRAEESSLRGLLYKEVKTAPSINVDKIFDMPPCQSACPIHQDIRGYTKLIAERKYEEALKLIRETNALPSVTGYICSHPCEEECRRNLADEPVSIKTLKRFVADFDSGKLIPPEISHKKWRKVSIIGSGPAGLAAGYDLSRIGYQVEIIEAFPEPGGMLRWAIPTFRLPRHVLSRDINYIRNMGVVMKTGVRFGIDVTLSDLKKDGADAVIMAVGTHKSSEMGLENERQTKDALTLLKKYGNGERVDLGDKVVVIGGGNAAIDVARATRRCGVEDVLIIYRRGKEEMLADEDEVKEAEAEGIEISYFSMPTRIIVNEGKVEGLECLKTELGEPDESGRKKPMLVQGSEFVVSAKSIVVAIGQQVDLSWNREGLPFNLSPTNTFITDDNCLTNVEGAFAAGDAVNGPTTVIEAMASGKRVARFVDLYLSNKV